MGTAVSTTDLPDKYWGPGDAISLDDVRTGAVDRTTEKLEMLARLFASGGVRTKPQARKIAKILGTTEYQIELLKKNPKMGKRVAELMKTAAIHYTAEAMPHMARRAKEDVQAFKVVGQMAEVIAQPGIGVQVNTNVSVANQRQGQEPEQVVAFIQTARDRFSAGFLRQLNKPKVEVVDAEVVEE